MKRQRPMSSASSSSSSPAAAARKQQRGGGGGSSSSASAAAFFSGTTILLVEDGREGGLTAKLTDLFIKNIVAHGGGAKKVMAADIARDDKKQKQQQQQKQKKKKPLLGGVTHVVTGLESLGARGVLDGLWQQQPIPAPMNEEEKGDGLQQQQQQPAVLVVKPAWVQACLQQRRLVEAATPEFLLPFEPSTPAAASPSSSMSSPRGAAATTSSTSTSTNPILLPPPQRTRAEIEAILGRDFPPEMDAATREAYIAWGGPLDIRTGRDMPRFACQRPAPRLHPNAHLTGVFEEIQGFYIATGDDKRVKSFGKALAVLRAWPRRIAGSRELKGAPLIGEGMLKEVDQILATGTSERLEAFRRDARSVGLKDLTRLHQVGAATAARWWAAGYHSVAQILAEVDAVVSQGGDPTETRFYQAVAPPHEPWMGVLHFRDYSQPMSRATVAALEARIRQAALRVLQEEEGWGAEALLLETCGGYRRGKEWNGDADVLVSCTRMRPGENGLPQAIVRVLGEEGEGGEIVVLKQGGAVQGYTDKGPPHEKLEGQNNTLVLIKHEGLFRRLDIISPPPDQWAACVLGWSGTTQVEKGLRTYAKEKGFYLTQQALYHDDGVGKRVRNPGAPDGLFTREEELWAYLGLKYIPPLLRWA